MEEMEGLNIIEGWDRGGVLEAVNLESALEPYTFRFEHSPFYLELYVGGLEGRPYRYEDEGALFMFAVEEGKRYRFFKPMRTKQGLDDMELYRRFSRFLEQVTPHAEQVTIYGVPDRKNVIRHIPRMRWKEFSQYTYDTRTTLEMKGEPYKSLREKINRFKNTGKQLVSEELSMDRLGDAFDILKKWKKLKEGKFKTFGLDQRLVLTARMYEEEEDILGMMFYLNKRPVAVHCAYPLEGNETRVAGHFTGICSLRLPGLYETTQVEFWRFLEEKGFSAVNDGPTWVESLEVFKKKFVPKKMLRVYQGLYP